MCIHGDKSQPERDWVLNGEFKTKHSSYSVLGIDIFSVKGPSSKHFGFANSSMVCVTTVRFCAVIAKN